ncbi:MAG: hypothetical protein AAF569_05680 [Pseudomonadota bacterium]
MDSALSIHFSPLIPSSVLILLTMLAFALLALSVWKTRHLTLWRGIAVAAFLLVLANPSLLEEDRQSVSDVALVVIDQSPSQSIGERAERSEDALNNIVSNLQAEDNLEVRVVRALEEASILAEETNIFEAIQNRVSDIPNSRRAGVIIISDGQIHDVPNTKDSASQFGPLHVLLSGDRDEKDRQIKVTQAPAYGLVGENAEITFQIHDTDNIAQSTGLIRMRWGSNQERTLFAPVGIDQTVRLPIENAGQNVFEIEVEAVNGELTEGNNKIAVVVNGVRDRLKVLLVSGQPHNGGRTWRDMLTADPGVDLVHFTILREPDKLDQTPQRELSLIAFPFRELFDIKLYDFDLIIFDRYQLNRIMPSYYFSNIVRYVREGGALLVSSGPSYVNEFSIYNTELREILPGVPAGQVTEAAFKPTITNLGLNHPVTMDFMAMSEQWGPWLRQISVTPNDADVVLSGLNNQPLMILDRVGKGRVAQIASDQIWLWSRGYKGGGPQRELLRRTSHWLMKEPELDESGLDAALTSDEILIRRRSLIDDSMDVVVQSPDGETETVNLSREGSVGWLTGRIPANQTGIFTISDGEKDHFVIAGSLNTPEMNSVITTDTLVKEASDASGGSIRWLDNDINIPDIRMLPEGRKYSGFGWIGLKQNNDYIVSGVQDRPFLPAWLALTMLMFLSVWMWWREGKTR